MRLAAEASELWFSAGLAKPTGHVVTSKHGNEAAGKSGLNSGAYSCRTNRIRNAIEVAASARFSASGDGQVAALDKVSVSIRENEFFTLLGPSGCGKTTLLRLIAGFDFPTEGEILLYGEDIAPLPPFKRPVNTVFQTYALFPHMTVGREYRLRPGDAGQAEGRDRGARRPRC